MVGAATCKVMGGWGMEAGEAWKELGVCKDGPVTAQPSCAGSGE